MGDIGKITLLVGLVSFANLGAAESGGYDPETAGGGGYDYLAVKKKEEQAHQDSLKKLEKERQLQVKKSEAKKALIREANKKNAPDYVAKMKDADFCVAYGRALRGQKMNDSKLNFDGADKIVLERARLNKLSMNYKLILEKNVQIDMKICDMYAAWGKPDDENRHVNSSGISIQHVYGRVYVYTDNGIVTSWQD